jgi:ABC-2 type transport system ATP-binding protein
MGATSAIIASGLFKSFGTLAVLRGVDLDVPAGTVFALLGPNGAGKTTIVRILTTLSRPDSGTARVAGFDITTEAHDLRRAISLTGQSVAIDELQTGKETLYMMGRLWGLSRKRANDRASELLERFGIADAATRRVGTYSGGMRRRLDLAASLVAEPAVIFLDEPTTGLDLPSRQTMWAIIEDLARRGTTVFVTTQYLEEADRLADQVAVIHNGSVVAQGTPAALKDRVGTERLRITFASPGDCDDSLRVLRTKHPVVDTARHSVEVDSDGTAAGARALLDAIDPDRSKVVRFELRRPTLDDVFLAYTTKGGKSSDRRRP